MGGLQAKLNRINAQFKGRWGTAIPSEVDKPKPAAAVSVLSSLSQYRLSPLAAGVTACCCVALCPILSYRVITHVVCHSLLDTLCYLLSFHRQSNEPAQSSRKSKMQSDLQLCDEMDDEIDSALEVPPTRGGPLTPLDKPKSAGSAKEKPAPFAGSLEHIRELSRTLQYCDEVDF